MQRCIDSIINQSYNNLEIILIDDGSTDNSYKICYDYSIIDTRIKLYKQQNEGASVARNLGLKKATGKYVAFVDSDDAINLDMFSIF